jgi:hypothetical protein
MLIGLPIVGIYIILDSFNYTNIFYSKNTINNRSRKSRFSDMEHFNQLDTTDKIKKIAENDTTSKSSDSPKNKKVENTSETPKTTTTLSASIPVTTDSPKTDSSEPPKVKEKVVKKITPSTDSDTPKKEAPKKEAPKKEEPKKEEPKKAEPKKEEPKKEAPKKEEPKKEAPKKEETKKEIKKIVPALATATKAVDSKPVSNKDNKPIKQIIPVQPEKPQVKKEVLKEAPKRKLKKLITRERAEEIIQNKLYEYIRNENLNLTEIQLLMKMIEHAKNKQFFTKLYSEEIYSKYIIKKNNNPPPNKISQNIVEKFSNVPSDIKKELQNSLRTGMNSSDLVLKNKDNNNESESSKTLSPNTIKKTVSNFVKDAVSKAVNSINIKKDKLEKFDKISKKSSIYIPTPRISESQSKRLSVDNAPPTPKKVTMNVDSESDLRIQKSENNNLKEMIKKLSNKIDMSEINSEKKLKSEKDVNNKLKDRIIKLERKLSSVKVYNPAAAEEDSSDLPYNDYNTPGLLPLGAGLQSWKNDYVLLNTDKWRPAINPIPHCKVEKECPVCPNMSAGYAKQYSTLKDFNKSRKVMPPDNINVDYINRLNAGK